MSGNNRAAVLCPVLFINLIAMGLPSVCSAQPLVADHTVVDKYADIPQVWIDEVKKMWVNIPGESHSSGYRIGCDLLENLDPRFQVNRTESGTPEPYTDQHLRISRATWDGGSWGYSYGEEDWYTNATAIANTKAHLTYANTHNLAISAMGFGWCWDTTWHNTPGGTVDPVYQVRWAGASEGGPQGDLRWGLDAADQALTGNSVSLDTYLAATQQYIDYCVSNNYLTKVFFTTGAIDKYPGEEGYQRYLKHQRIRDYVGTRDVILFDYADILSWGNDGTQNTESWTDYAGTPRTFQQIHPDNMRDLDGTYAEDGDHIGQRGALRLAKAMWWMLARIAGWDGRPAQSDTAPPTVVSTNPANAGTNIPTGSRITITFSEAVTNVGASTYELRAGGTTVLGAITTSGATATFAPSSPLSYATTYTATVTPGVTDLSGNPMALSYSWSFTTATTPDTAPPTVVSTSPANGATNVATGTQITITFSEVIDPYSAVPSAFSLDAGGPGLPLTVTSSGAQVTLRPASSLDNSATYTAVVTTGVRDLAGNHLAAAHAWTFTTQAASAATPSNGGGGGGCSLASATRGPNPRSGILTTLMLLSTPLLLAGRRALTRRLKKRT